MAVSVFDLFKIGIGPSSSHTVGPMRAARLFALRLQHEGLLPRVHRMQADLFGSLGATGKGHGSDKAVLLGLLGHEPDTVEVEAIPGLLKAVRDSGRLKLAGAQAIEFAEKRDLQFHRRESLPLHANGMRFTAFDAAGGVLGARVYYSVGGGFVVSDEIAADGSRLKAVAPDTTLLPLPFHSGAELLDITQREGCSIAMVMRINERHWRSDTDIDAGLLHIWQVMQDCVRRGCATAGTLPGGFLVMRRAPGLYRDLTSHPVAALREPRGGHGGRGRDRVALDAGDLHQAADRVAREPEVMLHRDLRGVLDLPVGAAHDGGEAARRHRARRPHLGLASALGPRDRRVRLEQRAERRRREQIAADAAAAVRLRDGVGVVDRADRDERGLRAEAEQGAADQFSVGGDGGG